MLKMKRFLVGLTAVMVFTLSFGQAFATSEKAGITADEALKMLLDGNVRFVQGKQESKKLGDDRRKELAKGQNPIAIILSCSDSRVPPEHIFNQGLGDIFVVRVAGNVADPIELGSIEYGAEHLNVPLVVVLGHKFCGAVKATVAGGKPEGNIEAIVKKINPAVAGRGAGAKPAAMDPADPQVAYRPLAFVCRPVGIASSSPRAASLFTHSTKRATSGRAAAARATTTK